MEKKEIKKPVIKEKKEVKEPKKNEVPKGELPTDEVISSKPKHYFTGPLTSFDPENNPTSC